MASAKRNTALAFLQTFKDLDGDSNIALRAPDCRHTIAPASLNFPSSMTNEQWAAHLSSLEGILSAFPVTAKEIFEQEASNQVTVWATSDAIFQEEAKDYDGDAARDWSYRGEYIFIFFFDAAGDKIERILEFVDSAKAVEMGRLLERAKRNLAARKNGSG